ncbi:DNA recombination protein RmuC [Salsipaludibacter albus]|uniref:DNA recombination protein RmuC n=1 Tax=Salsipaludibacter albus TaxID=2849650 RepID=UPI001EE474A9|nr:DNA recombination protein RmuC [Salsipaludibacter albus]MBY5163375.1 DNA recombination protein RmuC [Salsipaludibacter albus]
MTTVAWVALVLVVAGVAAIAATMAVRSLTRRQDAATEHHWDALRTELDAQRSVLEERNSRALHDAVRTVVDLAGDKLTTENAASRAMLEERDRTLEERASRMTAEFERMRELVAELDRERSRGMGDLQRRLEEASRATGELSRTTGALKEALASSRARGQWGERMAEDVLRAAGFVKGINYEVQQTTSRGRPDITFLLPAGRHLHMDVKFPLDNYLKSLECDDEAVAHQAVRAFVKDARNRVRELARRDYGDTTEGSLDEVLLFLPNEQVYAFLHDVEPGLLDEALSQRIILCSPVTLFAVLAVIRQAVDDHMTEQRSAEILDALNGFSDQWERFVEHLEKVGDRITSAQRAFDTVNGVRRRQLERQLEAIDDLHHDERAAAVLALAPREDVDEAAS